MIKEKIMSKKDTINRKQFKMTDVELEAYLKIKAQGSGTTKDKTKFQRHAKHRNQQYAY